METSQVDTSQVDTSQVEMSQVEMSQVEMSQAQTIATVTVRYFAAARAAAGTDCERLNMPTGSSVGSVLATISDRHGGELARVLGRCSFLLDEVAVRDKDTGLPDGATLDVLPPFAGG